MEVRRYLTVLFSLITFVISWNATIVIVMANEVEEESFLTVCIECLGCILVAALAALLFTVIVHSIFEAFRSCSKEKRLELFWFFLLVLTIGIYISYFILFPFLQAYGFNVNLFILITILVVNSAHLARSPIKIFKGEKKEQENV